MHIHGVDFTSAPSRRKPITWAKGWLEGTVLTIAAVHELVDLAAFGARLARPGPWVAALDFPFALPAETVAALGWPADWAAYVERVAALPHEAFLALLERERAVRPAGEKYRYRAADRLAHAASPLNARFPPVARMFFRGAPLLLRSRCAILPCRPNGDDRIVVEGYPKMVARFAIGQAPYKGRAPGGRRSPAERKDEEDKRRARRGRIVAVITGTIPGARGRSLGEVYDCSVRLDQRLRERLGADGEGDRLDAVLSAVVAAWAHMMRERNWGIPPDRRPEEGWIVDPALI